MNIKKSVGYAYPTSNQGRMFGCFYAELLSIYENKKGRLKVKQIEIHSYSSLDDAIRKLNCQEWKKYETDRFSINPDTWKGLRTVLPLNVKGM